MTTSTAPELDPVPTTYDDLPTERIDFTLFAIELPPAADYVGRHREVGDAPMGDPSSHRPRHARPFWRRRLDVAALHDQAAAVRSLTLLARTARERRADR